MAGLKKRGRIWWVRFYVNVNGKRIEKSLGTEDPRDARRQAKTIEARQTLGIQEPPSGLSAERALAAYFQHLDAVRCRKSARSDKSRLRRFFSEVSAQTLSDVTPAHIQSYMDKLRLSGRAPKTANEYRTALHALFSFALNYLNFDPPDLRFPNPAGKVKKFRVPAPEITYLKPEDIARQLETLKGHPQIHALVTTYIFAGLRRAEALWLTKEDVVLDGPTPRIHVRAKSTDGSFWQPKTKTNRAVPISSRLLPVLRAYAATLSPDTAWFFPSPAGKRWNEDNFSANLRAMQMKAGLTWGCLDFRHTFGTHLARNGVSLFKISKLLGNSPAICQLHYSNVMPEELTKEVELVASG